MAESRLKVLITTSGLGSRLGDLTKYTNKALVKIGDRASISYVIDSYPDADFVITLGYFGSHVRQFLEIAHPKRNFEFVEVTPYIGEGSGLVKSLSFAKDKLQCPFVFHVCDTILSELPPIPDKNWMACVNPQSPDLFRTVCVNGTTITKVNEKGEMNYDFAYVGVAGIFEYELFWTKLELILDNNIVDSSDCHVFKEMILETNIHYWYTNNYNDTGSVENLNVARDIYTQKYKVLDKVKESIYFNEGRVIKFFADEELCKNRVLRTSRLNGLVPKLLGNSSNFYSYEYAEGELLARVITEDKISKLIEWATNRLWTDADVVPKTFKEQCEYFYITKTEERISDYLELTKTLDKDDVINECLIPSCSDMLKNIDWNLICNAVPVRFHGDFILDNILYTDKDDFVLLDWRQDFGGNIDAGDKYYDLAKLNHNLTINHDMLSNDHYYVKSTPTGIYCDIFRSHNMVQCQQAFFKSIEAMNYDKQKINLMTSLIWINMSPLHEYPLNKFLFYFGKYNLWRNLND